MTADEALLDCAEHRLVGLDVHVDILKLADLVAVAVEQLLTAPVRDVADFSHLDLLSPRPHAPRQLYPGACVVPRRLPVRSTHASGPCTDKESPADSSAPSANQPDKVVGILDEGHPTIRRS